MKKRIILLVFLLKSGAFAMAQAPDLVPYGEPDPLELTPVNIIFFIVLPILLFVALIFIRRKRKNKS